MALQITVPLMFVQPNDHTHFCNASKLKVLDDKENGATYQYQPVIHITKFKIDVVSFEIKTLFDT